MAFYAGRVILHPAMENPTLVILTDRNDLDDQLFGTFARCQGLLRQPPVQAVDRADLRTKLSVASGGVVFTTIQRFFPEEVDGATVRIYSVRKYQNRAIETAQVIEELIGLAKDMRAANARGVALNLTDDELAFYDALEANDSAVKVLGEPTLATIARELVATVRKNVTIDWTVRENVHASYACS